MLEPSLVRDVLDAALATGGDFAEIFFEVYTINKPHAIVKIANGTFKMNMEIVTEIIVIKDTIT